MFMQFSKEIPVRIEAVGAGGEGEFWFKEFYVRLEALPLGFREIGKIRTHDEVMNGRAAFVVFERFKNFDERFQKIAAAHVYAVAYVMRFRIFFCDGDRLGAHIGRDNGQGRFSRERHCNRA